MALDIWAENVGRRMAISCKTLCKLLIDKDMKKKCLQRVSDISTVAVAKLVKNESVKEEIIKKFVWLCNEAPAT